MAAARGATCASSSSHGGFRSRGIHHSRRGIHHRDRLSQASRDFARLAPTCCRRRSRSRPVVENLRSRSSAEIADALLNQRVLAGLGNVYKSEVLFLSAQPVPAVSDALSDSQLTSIVETGRTRAQDERVRRAAVDDDISAGCDGRRTGAPTERLWVYGRARLPCRRCGTAISVRKQGRRCAADVLVSQVSGRPRRRASVTQR